MTLRTLLWLALAACNEDPGKDAAVDADADTDTDTDTDTDADADTDTDTDSDVDTPCSVEIETTVPLEGATDAYYRADIELWLSDPDPEGFVSLSTAAGDPVQGAAGWSPDGKVVTFTPLGGLAPATDYVAALTWCGGRKEIAFRTSDLGVPVTDPAGLAGRAWTVDLASARWIEPYGVGSLMLSFIQQTPIVGVLSSEGGSVEARVGVAAEGEAGQDFCAPTTAVPPVDFSGNPDFRIGPIDITLALGAATLIVDDFVMTGTWNAAGTAVGGASLTGLLDTRPLVPLLGGSNDAAVCTVLSGLGVSCTACDDKAELCLTLHLDQMSGVELGAPLEEIGQADCHAQCEASAKNPECEL